MSIYCKGEERTYPLNRSAKSNAATVRAKTNTTETEAAVVSFKIS